MKWAKSLIRISNHEVETLQKRLADIVARRWAIQAQIDAIEVELTHDTAPRTVEPPADFAAALDAAGLRDAFDRLAPSHQKAHVTAIESAKADATRQRRIEAAVAKLAAG